MVSLRSHYRLIVDKGFRNSDFIPESSFCTSEDIMLDIGKDERVIGIEILGASKRVNLERLLPIKYETPKGVAS